MLVKSELARSPAAWICRNITTRPGPTVACHCRTRRSNVRRWLAANCPGCSVTSQSNRVLALSLGSADNRSATAGHTAANGSRRVRYIRGGFAALGKLRDERYLRAVFASMPALLAA